MRNLLLATVAFVALCSPAFAAGNSNNSGNVGTITSTTETTTTVGTENVVVNKTTGTPAATTGSGSTASGGTAAGGASNSGGNSTTIKVPAPAYAPALAAMAVGADNCVGAITASAGGGGIFAIGFGFTHKDAGYDDCNGRAYARTFLLFGRNDMAWGSLCMSDFVRQVAQINGTPCPQDQGQRVSQTTYSTVQTTYPTSKPNSYDRTYARPSSNGVN